MKQNKEKPNENLTRRNAGIWESFQEEEGSKE